jgi:putative ABC transport system permease protein
MMERCNISIVVPLATVQGMFRTEPAAEGEELKNENMRFDEIWLKIPSPDHIEQAIDQILNVLAVTHNGIHDVGFNTEEDWVEAIEGRVASLKVSGGLTALVSLIVGGIGITSVMLASMRQRIREIGIRRAVGARGIDIFVQIMTESTALSCVGGLIGLAGGVLLMSLLGTLAVKGAQPLLEMSAILISFTSAVAIGMLSGLYPAYRGMSVPPGEALREE